MKQLSPRAGRRRWGDLSWVRNRKGMVVALPLASVVVAVSVFVGIHYVGGGHADSGVTASPTASPSPSISPR